jgi:hypothetical protein
LTLGAVGGGQRPSLPKERASAEVPIDFGDFVSARRHHRARLTAVWVTRFHPSQSMTTSGSPAPIVQYQGCGVGLGDPLPERFEPGS